MSFLLLLLLGCGSRKAPEPAATPTAQPTGAADPTEPPDRGERVLTPASARQADPAPRAARPFTVCASDALRDVQPAGSPYRQLACERPCDGPPLSCAVDEDERDASGKPLRRLTFAVGGMAGFLRWTQGKGKPTAGVLVHAGSAGTEFRDGDRAFWAPLEADGLRVIGVRWHPGVIDPVSGSAWGWLQKPDDQPFTHREAAGRVAAVIRFAHDHLVPDPAPFGLFGTSNGGLATLAAVAWYDLDPIVDWHLLSSGALIFDQAARCRALAGKLPPTGLCEDAPEQDCRSDADCGGPKDRCAWPHTELMNARRTDYRLGTGEACQHGEDDPRFDDTSLGRPPHTGLPPADLDYDHPVDFVVAEGLKNPENDDTFMGFTWQMGMAYRRITTTDPRGKRWIDLDGYAHGNGSGHPDHAADLACGIRRGLNLPACAKGSR